MKSKAASYVSFEIEDWGYGKSNIEEMCIDINKHTLIQGSRDDTYSGYKCIEGIILIFIDSFN